jgi:hypothetical protein
MGTLYRRAFSPRRRRVLDSRQPASHALQFEALDTQCGDVAILHRRVDEVACAFTAVAFLFLGDLRFVGPCGCDAICRKSATQSDLAPCVSRAPSARKPVRQRSFVARLLAAGLPWRLPSSYT